MRSRATSCTDAQPGADRAARHARLVEILEARLERQPDHPIAEIAHHAVMAARGGLDASPALRWSRGAAREAAGVLAFAEAALHLDRALEALELGELGTAEERLALLLDAAATSGDAGRLEASQRRYAEAAALARRLGDAGASRARRSATRSSSTTESSTRRRSRCSRRPARCSRPTTASCWRRWSAGSPCGSIRRPGSPREALLDEAIAMARAVGDRAALARMLALSPLVHWRPESSERREADAAEVIALAASGGDREAALWARIVLHADRFADGDVAGADRELAAYDRLAGELGRRYYRWYGQVMAATRAIFDGRLDAGGSSPRRRSATTASTRKTPSRNGSCSRCCSPASRVGPTTCARRAARLRRALSGHAGVARPPGGGGVGGRERGRGAGRERGVRAPRPGGAPPDPDLPCTLTLLADVSAAVGGLRSGELRGLEPTRRATS